MNRKPLLLSVLAGAIVLFAAASWYVGRSEPLTDVATVPPEQIEALLRPHSPILGPQDAPVTIVEFFDPACEACRAYYPVVKEIMAEHGSAVRVGVRYTAFHGAGSEEAIRILEAARMQGVFEPVLEAILTEQPRWASHGAPEPGLILQIAGSAGLDIAAAQSQMLMPDVVAVMNQDRTDVETMGIRQTPTFFVNGKPVEPFGEAELRALVAAEVAATES